MSTSSQNSDSSHKSSETALILEHVELLLALCEDKSGSHPSEMSRLLDSKVTEISSSLENQLENRFEKLESQIETIVETIVAQNATLEDIGRAAHSSPDSSTALEERQLELEQKFELATEKFSDKTDTIARLFNSQMDQLCKDLGSKVATLTQEAGQQNSKLEPAVEPTSGESANHWHKQKEAMLSKYGIDPDYRPVMELTESTTIDESVEEQTPVNPILAISEEDALDIEELKNQLNTKLRDAEVELSIGRAKISQQAAELDAEQVELDRRAAAIEEKFAAVARVPQQRVGFFGWLWNHLKPKQPAANDRA